MNEMTESRILIADDTVRNLQILGDVLEREGFQINVAQNGQQALDIAAKVTPDLILLDVMMPEMDGFEVCRGLKANPITAGIPVIFLTAKVETDDIVKGFELGAVDYITKPFNTTELLVRVRTHLSIHLLQAALKQSLSDIDRMRREQEAFLRHELNNRIAPIMGYADMLMEAVGDERHKRWSTSISTATQDMSDLIEALRSLQELEAGTYELTKRSMSPQRILASVIENWRASGATTAEIQLESGSDDVELDLDINLMNGVFLNLIKNAAEHVDELESGSDRVVTVSIEHRLREVNVSIHNGGPPIPPERIDSFFEKFNTLGKEGGTGLGTTYAALVTHAHSGTIKVTSSEEEGTTVTVTLPSS
jgi:two-component system, sensor histidine kinase and response regulator